MDHCGYAWDADDEELKNDLRAVRAEDANDAREQIYRAYDSRPGNLRFRFCESREKEWSPWSLAPGVQDPRFPKADWMVW